MIILDKIFDTTPDDLLPKIERLVDMIRPAWLQTENFHIEPQQIYRGTEETIEIKNDPEGYYLVLQGVQIGFIGIYQNSPIKSRVFVELLDQVIENPLAAELVHKLAKGITRELNGQEEESLLSDGENLLIDDPDIDLNHTAKKYRVWTTTIKRWRQIYPLQNHLTISQIAERLDQPESNIKRDFRLMREKKYQGE